MIKNIVVEVEERKNLGKNASGRYRRQGLVPGIVYGLGLDPFPVAVPTRRVEEVLLLETGRNTIFKLQLTGQDRSRAVMIKDLQRDPVSEKIDHVDFVRVDLERRIRVNVPIRLIGIPEGVKVEGGILEHVIRAVEVECLPTAIPEHLDADVTALHVGQNLSIEEGLHVPEGVTILDDIKSIIVVVAAPVVEEEPVADVAEAAGAEPELIKKGKDAADDAEGKKSDAKKPEAKKAEPKK